MLLRILFCAALTVLLLAAGYWLSCRVLLPLRGRGMYTVLYCTGDGEELETQVRAYLLLRGLGVLRLPLLLVDAGLTDEGRALTQKLAGLDGSVRLCEESKLTDILRNGV